MDSRLQLGRQYMRWRQGKGSSYLQDILQDRTYSYTDNRCPRDIRSQSRCCCCCSWSNNTTRRHRLSSHSVGIPGTCSPQRKNRFRLRMCHSPTPQRLTSTFLPCNSRTQSLLRARNNKFLLDRGCIRRNQCQWRTCLGRTRYMRPLQLQTRTSQRCSWCTRPVPPPTHRPSQQCCTRMFW